MEYQLIIIIFAFTHKDNVHKINFLNINKMKVPISEIDKIMSKKDGRKLIKDIYLSRPFIIRNADELDTSNVLSLFADPVPKIRNPFEYENMIIKGKMGTGKTMLLRANYAFHTFTLYTSFIEQSEKIILPFFIQLSELQHLSDPGEIYKRIIIKMANELLNSYKKLEVSSKSLVNLHFGMQKFPPNLYFDEKTRDANVKLLKLPSDEYEKQIKDLFEAKVGISNKYFNVSLSDHDTIRKTFENKENPSIQDIHDLYKLLFNNEECKILLLFDEVSSINKSFFNSKDQPSMFEILMNQLRTCNFIRTKIAIYSDSYSDILTETRYGDTISLDIDVMNKNDYLRFREQAESLMSKYLNLGIDVFFKKYQSIISDHLKRKHVKYSNELKTELEAELGRQLEAELEIEFVPDLKIELKDIFQIDINENRYGDSIEQIIYGSNGNIRRFIHLLDRTMITASKLFERSGFGKVTILDAQAALRDSCNDELKNLFSTDDKLFIESIGSICKKHRTFRFKYPRESRILTKLINKSDEFKIFSVFEAGSGGKANIYSINYSFCVYYDIPTHTYKNKIWGEIDNARSLIDGGKWIDSVIVITEEMFNNSVNNQ